MTKKKRHFLQFDIEIDFALIAISSHQKGFKLCWSINNSCKLKLKRTDDVWVELKSSTAKVPFATYSFFNPETELEYLLIENRNQGYNLLPEIKAADYFLILKGMYNANMVNELLEELKNNPYILTFFEVNTSQLINKQHLYFLL